MKGKKKSKYRKYSKKNKNKAKTNKNKAQTNKTNCMRQKYGSNLFAVFTRASIVMILQILIILSLCIVHITEFEV